MEELNDLGILASVGISEQEDLQILSGEYSLIFGSAKVLLKKRVVGEIQELQVDGNWRTSHC